MQTKFVHFNVENGYLDHWLLAGPQKFWVEEDKFTPETSLEQIASQYEDPELGIEDLPVERGPLTSGKFIKGDYTGSWEYYACGEDHRVDQSVYIPLCAFLRSWAYNQLNSKVEQPAVLQITTQGPMRIWLNGVHLAHQQDFSGSEPAVFSIPILLQKGKNPLFIRFENFGQGHSAHHFTARILPGDPSGQFEKVEIHIPSLIKTIGRRNQLEKAYHSLYMDRDVYSYDQQIWLHWPLPDKKTKKEVKAFSAVRLLHQSRVYAEAEVDGIPGDRLGLGMSAQYPEGNFEVLMMPMLWEYYEHDLRITHKLSMWSTGRQQFATLPVGDAKSRKQEALAYAARQEEESVYREMARIALDRWEMVEEPTLTAALDRVTQRQQDSLVDLLGLLGLLSRFGSHEQFPDNLKTAIETAALAYRYEPVRPVLADANSAGAGESRALLAGVCQILAGQVYPDRKFTAHNLTGSELRLAGEEQAVRWIRQRITWGFAGWGSEPGFEETLAGLSHLVDLAESEPVWEIAGALLDKLFFTIALNSFQGLYGGTSSQARSLSLKGGVPSAFSGIARLMWGQGIFTPHITGLVSLACNQNYDLPEPIARVATQPLDELWSKERHTSGSGDEGANQAAYKTPDYLLSSVQSYCPGQAGRGEHVWQAALGPGAVVFTNHPGASAESEAHLPGYWRGNGVLPRIAQWNDALVCLYQLPETAPLDFTHAYFPTFAFDEYEIKQGWAFARKGNAYLALTAANPIELTKKGPYAYRELRSNGRQNAWYCQMGRAARDGDFAAFQKKVLAARFAFQDGTARCLTASGDQLELGWQGPFLVNQSEEPLSGFRHYENAYTTVEFPCVSMEIQTGEDVLLLHLE
jgi:hypothetical protein